MKKDINSNRYIFLYTTIMVVIVAVLLTVAAIWLQPYQQRNKDNEQRINILKAAGVKGVDKDNAAQRYEQHCTASLKLDEKRNESSEGTYPLYIIDNQYYVIPMKGKGLWGPISGYLALTSDGSTVIGANFDHESETPGLGGEITSEKFQQQFQGKKVTEVAQRATVEFDAITGATRTSRGVEEMIENTLSIYLPYINNGHLKQ